MEENYQNAYKYLIEPLRSGGAGGGGRMGEEAVRCAPAPAAEANITPLTWKTRMMMCVYQCALCVSVCVCGTAYGYSRQ